jgi:hypothetical protein
MSDSDKNTNTASGAPVESVDEGKQEAILNKYDKDASAEKERTGLLGKIVGVGGGLVALYVVITCGWRAPEA